MQSLALALPLAEVERWGLRVFVVLFVVVFVVLVVRWKLIDRSLRQRASWSVLPADEFDPAKEDVVRYALKLGRVHSRLRVHLLRPSAAVRIRFDSVPEGQLQVVLVGPANGGLVLRSAMFDQVELRDLSDDPAAPASRPVVGGVQPDVDLLTPKEA